MTPEQKVCISCQECCKWITFTVELTGQMRDFYIHYFGMRGCRINYQTKTKVNVTVPSICPNLTTFGCKIYKQRPYLCQDYDGRKDLLIDCKLREENNAEEKEDSKAAESKEATAG